MLGIWSAVLTYLWPRKQKHLRKQLKQQNRTSCRQTKSLTETETTVNVWNVCNCVDMCWFRSSPFSCEWLVVWSESSHSHFMWVILKRYISKFDLWSEVDSRESCLQVKPHPFVCGWNSRLGAYLSFYRSYIKQSYIGLWCGFSSRFRRFSIL